MLILLRHGQTKANASGLLQGRIDNRLDEVGRDQAAAAGRSLGPVDRVICSPLLRAQETASYLELAKTTSEVEVDERLIELDYGSFDGRPISDLSPARWEQWRADPEFRLPGGETLLELRQRMWSCLDDRRHEAAHATIVLVTHMSPIKSAVQWALGVDDEISWRLRLATASMTTLAVRGSAVTLTSFNDTSHLSLNN
jgi:broad specificity phosphatase PhoE